MVGYTLYLPPLIAMTEYKIEDYVEQLKQLCSSCRKYKKCSHDKICAFKKLAWTMAKRKLKKKERNELTNNGSI